MYEGVTAVNLIFRKKHNKNSSVKDFIGRLLADPTDKMAEFKDK